jgi:AraC family transcriptional regulator of adaptative response / DNA-3-methyladenine glycosylase II
LRTRRLHLARQLLDGSDLPMIDVAESAGFHSVRRFNDAIRDAFGRTPTELRGNSTAAGAGLTLRLPFRPPLDFAALLRFFAPRALQGVEEVSGEVWRRTLREGVLEVRSRADALEVRLPPVLAPKALQIAARVSHVFDLRADPQAIRRHLAKDSVLCRYLKPGLRVPGAWDPFEMAVRAILGQQITVAGARNLADRLVQQFGETLPHGRLFPTAEKLAEAELTGMPASRARAVSELARAVASGRVRLDGTQGAEALLELPGIGDWTAQLIALRALGEPDAFPAADLGLCRTLGLTPRELLTRAEDWRPWRGTAAAALWLSCGGEDDASR